MNLRQAERDSVSKKDNRFRSEHWMTRNLCKSIIMQSASGDVKEHRDSERQELKLEDKEPVCLK